MDRVTGQDLLADGILKGTTPRDRTMIDRGRTGQMSGDQAQEPLSYGRDLGTA